ncbi:uncharacterized protein BDW47DRAFT_113082 [Aspergillus candidus]|uniref:Uncharacterized protein n=1 Tax=Aspergillus candidus TaxID=41067 RepID=A0A2I2F025_ASPCN|nr:hypothetical protein BDW47DRAFT_113082 [Aspergillus candidus]PLB33995.1 hypothetical protein BDW47DRAFT_113082 [Aspergillus candidus]
MYTHASCVRYPIFNQMNPLVTFTFISFNETPAALLWCFVYEFRDRRSMFQSRQPANPLFICTHYTTVLTHT